MWFYFLEYTERCRTYFAKQIVLITSRFVHHQEPWASLINARNVKGARLNAVSILPEIHRHGF
jgi:hypothetical protein